MKKLIPILSLPIFAISAFAQSPMDAGYMSQYDLRGTARFMGMAGAFGALGGDLSTLSQNPAGIGIYRSSEIGFTLDLDFNSSKSHAGNYITKDNHTKFYLNNIGGVATLRLKSNAVPNLNLGFTYNKAASFSRRYKGYMPDLNTSLSNYIAGINNAWDLTEVDVKATSNYDPYYDNMYGRQVPWISILGYDSYLVNPEGDPQNPNWKGQFGDGTSGNGIFEMEEKGSIDEYNIAIGGNIKNIVYWGMDFDIVSIDYSVNSIWGEGLTNAYVYNPNANVGRGGVERMNADWRLRNDYKINGTGFNYKLGVIVKPIQELRLGFTFHTPTYYNLTQTCFDQSISFKYPFLQDTSYTNGGTASTFSYDFRSPWRIIASAAGVIANKFIVSADYEWRGYKNMKYSAPNSYGVDYYDPDYGWDTPWDYPWGWDYGPSPRSRSEGSAYAESNGYIKEIYQNSNTLRLGAEWRVIPSFSLRVGYSFTSSPITAKARDNKMEIPSSGTMTSYRMDNTTNYITAGVGYRVKKFYADLAYVYKRMDSEYHPFTPDVYSTLPAMQAKLTFNTSQLVLSMGFRF